MTVLTIVFNVVLSQMFGTFGAALGTIASSTLVSAYGVWRLFAPGSVIHFNGNPYPFVILDGNWSSLFHHKRPTLRDQERSAIANAADISRPSRAGFRE